MNTDAPNSPAMLWGGRVLSGLVVLFMVFDSVTKIAKVPAVVEASTKLGVPSDAILGLGVVLLVCTVIYAIPKTSVLGAILLTGYLGGASATHLIAKSGAFPMGFSVVFGVLAWAGLVLRDPRLFGTIVSRK